MNIARDARLLVLLGLGSVACEAETENGADPDPRVGDAGIRGLLVAQSWDHVHLISGEARGSTG